MREKVEKTGRKERNPKTLSWNTFVENTLRLLSLYDFTSCASSTLIFGANVTNDSRIVTNDSRTVTNDSRILSNCFLLRMKLLHRPLLIDTETSPFFPFLELRGKNVRNR